MPPMLTFILSGNSTLLNAESGRLLQAARKESRRTRNARDDICHKASLNRTRGPRRRRLLCSFATCRLFDWSTTRLCLPCVACTIGSTSAGPSSRLKQRFPPRCPGQKDPASQEFRAFCHRPTSSTSISRPGAILAPREASAPQHKHPSRARFPRREQTASRCPEQRRLSNRPRHTPCLPRTRDRRRGKCRASRSSTPSASARSLVFT